MLFEVRSRRAIGQRELGRIASVPASTISAVENGRRIPPRDDVVDRICTALGCTNSERQWLTQIAANERATCGLRIGRSIPPHVALLIRELSRNASVLTPLDVEAVRSTLKEFQMT